MSTKRIFITGAAGFIGFHLANHVYSKGDKLLGIDNFNDYYDPQLKHRRALELKKNGIEVVGGEITDRLFLQKQIEDFQPTHLVHLAAQAGVRYSLVNPEVYLSSNIDGFLNILEICRKHPSITLTFASSSSVYGANTKIPFSEQDLTDSPVSLYGATKKSNELMAYAYHHLFGIKATALRYFTVYGPWGRPDMAYYSFTKSIFEGRPIDIYNFGHMKRDFTYIQDIIEGTYSAMELAAPWEVFNLGNHQPEDLSHMIGLIEKHLHMEAKKNLLPMQAGDVVSTYADISNSQAKLGFFPKVTLAEGIPRFIEWFKDYHQLKA